MSSRTQLPRRQHHQISPFGSLWTGCYLLTLRSLFWHCQRPPYSRPCASNRRARHMGSTQTMARSLSKQRSVVVSTGSWLCCLRDASAETAPKLVSRQLSPTSRVQRFSTPSWMTQHLSVRQQLQQNVSQQLLATCGNETVRRCDENLHPMMYSFHLETSALTGPNTCVALLCCSSQRVACAKHVLSDKMKASPLAALAGERQRSSLTRSSTSNMSIARS